MSLLTPNTPFISKTPLIRVDDKLTPGTLLFSLTVVDDSGNASAPAHLRVTVARPTQAAIELPRDLQPH
jgi:hypothetical protein